MHVKSRGRNFFTSSMKGIPRTVSRLGFGRSVQVEEETVKGTCCMLYKIRRKEENVDV